MSYLIVVFSYSFFTGIADLAVSEYILVHSTTLASAIIASGLILLYLKSTMDHELINNIYLLEEKVTGMLAGNQEHSFEMIVHHLHDLTRRLVQRNEQVLLAK